MAAQRPRLSILTLFDPLSSSSDSPDSDKENDCGDTFFHLSKQVYSPVRRLRRRLIDVGDMTVEEPDIRDLIEEELEAEINQTVALEEDENATLTFRDMAMAATPKWSGKHAGRKGTPNKVSTPRTPLAEIVARDEVTPVGRKKLFKRPPASSIPAASQLSLVHKDVPTLVVHDLGDMSENPPLTIPIPRTVIPGSDDETTKKSTSLTSMEASTATLELPTPSDTLISDTPIPFFVSSSSPETNRASRAPSPLTESRLRPNLHVRESSNRHSVDLHSSFQLHLSTSETTFDLLNDKISFLSSKNGLDSFLDHDVSFCDDEDFSEMNPEPASENEQRMGHPETQLKLDLSETTSEDHVNEPELRDNTIRDRHASLHGRDGMPTSLAGKKSSCALETVECIPDTSPSDALSALSPFHPFLHLPRPVPALRIVKRSKALEQAKATERKRCDSRSTSRGRTNNILASRAPKRTSLGDASFVLASNGIKNGGQAKGMSRSASTTARDDQAAGGPRRVLATEARNVRDIAQAKLVNGIDGPRRVHASETVNKARTKAEMPAGKYASASAVSGIPKPVTSRNLGSKIPAPPSSKRVQIETGKGFLSRRLAGK